MNDNITISNLRNQYKNYLQSANSQINAYSPNSFWDIDSGAMAAILLDLYINLQIVQNSIYPQYSSGDQVDQWLYSRGLPARIGATYGSVICILNSAAPATISINQTFTNGNITYQSLQNITITNNTTVFTLYSLTPSLQQNATINMLLTSGTVVVKVQTITQGTQEETDQSAINRVLQSVLIPQAGARQTDYSVFAIKANSQVTYSIIIPSYKTISGVGILGIFPLVGNVISNYTLDQSFVSFIPYSRQASSDVINSVNVYIQNQKLVGLTAIIGSCNTYILPSFTVTVSILNSYSLSSPITYNSQDADNNPIQNTLTVQQLIQRTIRAGICNQPYGGTIINNHNYITIDSLITYVNSQLSVNNGQLAQILTNITFSVSDIDVPEASQFVTSSIIKYTYDIASYNAITVILA